MPRSNDPRLAPYPGNDVQQAQAYLLATDPAFAGHLEHERVFYAGQWLRAQGRSTVAMSAPGGPKRILLRDTPENVTRTRTRLTALMVAAHKAEEAEDDEALVLAMKDIIAACFELAPDLAEEIGVLKRGKLEELDTVEKRREAVKACAGRNDVERAITLLLSESPGFGQLSWGEQVSRAGRYVREGAAILMGGQ